MSPKVSIIIPTYNRSRYLPEALESALNQTYSNTEIIVVNDGSTDDTEQVLARYMPHIRYIKRENGGCAVAKNTGLDTATGEFITNLDDDDRIHPEKVARQVEMFQQRPEMGICGTGVNFIDAMGQITERYMPSRFSRKTQTLQLLRRCSLVQPSVMIRRQVHDRIGVYKDMLSEDYEFWLRASLHYGIGVVDEYLTDYRQHGDQITGPAMRPQLMAAVEQLIRDFVTQTPLEQIIPGLRIRPFGDALIGVLLGEQKLFTLAETYSERALPDPVGDFGLGLLRIDERKFTEARACFERVRASNSLFVSKLDEAHRLLAQVQMIIQNQEHFHNMSPQVVQLRKDLSHFRSSVIGQLLKLAKGKSLT